MGSGRKHIDPYKIKHLATCTHDCAPSRWTRVMTDDPEYQDLEGTCIWCEDPNNFPGVDERRCIHTPPGDPTRGSTPSFQGQIETPPGGWFPSIGYLQPGSNEERHREGSHSSHASLAVRSRSSNGGLHAPSPLSNIAANTPAGDGSQGSISRVQDHQSSPHRGLSHSPVELVEGERGMPPPARPTRKHACDYCR